jgi:tetratricopeptide (TPR) repeat protein
MLLGVVGLDLRYRDELSKAREAAQRALEIDDRVGRAHAALGNVWLFYDWDFPAARRAFERAVQLSPSDPSAIDGYAFFLLFVEGRAKEALELSERLLRVAPLDLYWRGQRVGHFYWNRQYEHALEEVERVRLLDPDSLNWFEIWSYAGLGRPEEAYHAYITFVERCGAPCDWEREALERGWAEGGWEGSLRAWIETATHIEGYSPWMIAATHTWIGAKDDALAWLERGYRDRDPLMIQTKADPVFDSLRSDPRFDDLLRRIGFPEE